MKRWYRYGGWLAFAAMVTVMAAGDEPPPRSVPLLVAGQVFDLELALAPDTREHGLMERNELPPDRGMLFVFPDLAPRRFWMKNTRVDLDIIYLDDAGRVVSTASMRRESPRGERETEEQYEERLPLYPSAGPARFAIELPAGTLPLLSLSVGDRLSLEVEQLRAMAR